MKTLKARAREILKKYFQQLIQFYNIIITLYLIIKKYCIEFIKSIMIHVGVLFEQCNRYHVLGSMRKTNIVIL